MAFDQPIEADRIDDFNLFSAFVRAPLWLLGGVLGAGSRNNEDDSEDSPQLDDLCDQENEAPMGLRRSAPSTGSHTSLDGGERDLSQDRKIRHSGHQGMASIYEGPPGMEGSKNLSWSDQSGMSLVEYHDEVSEMSNARAKDRNWKSVLLLLGLLWMQHGSAIVSIVGGNLDELFHCEAVWSCFQTLRVHGQHPRGGSWFFNFPN